MRGMFGIGDWRERSACRQSDPDLFFPAGTPGQTAGQIVEAKRVCATCPVREPCLEYALVSNEDFGIWGGATEEERRRIRKRWLAERRVLVG